MVEMSIFRFYFQIFPNISKYSL